MNLWPGCANKARRGEAGASFGNKFPKPTTMATPGRPPAETKPGGLKIRRSTFARQARLETSFQRLLDADDEPLERHPLRREEIPEFPGAFGREQEYGLAEPDDAVSSEEAWIAILLARAADDGPFRPPEDEMCDGDGPRAVVPGDVVRHDFEGTVPLRRGEGPQTRSNPDGSHPSHAPPHGTP